MNINSCPICNDSRYTIYEQQETNCLIIKYNCGTQLTMATWEGGNDPDYYFDKKCNESKLRDNINMIPNQITPINIKTTNDINDIRFMNIANEVSKWSKCVSKQVGSIIVKDKRIISIGYNGTPEGWKNCNEVFNCNDYNREEHHKFSERFEVHGEMNAIHFATRNGISLEGSTLYCTLQPCLQCIKNICQQRIKRIVFRDVYDLTTYDEEVFDLLESCSIIIEKI